MKQHDAFESVPCPLCKNERLRRLAQTGQFGLPCNVSICSNDGLVFLSPRWSKERYFQFYQNEYDQYYRPAILVDEANDAKYRNIRTICSRLESLGLLSGRHAVLDVGAGMGWSLEWLKANYSQFHRFSAIESSRHCIAHLEDNRGIEVVSNDIDSDWDASSFDLVIMRHVLEHLMDPVVALSKIANSLSDEGIVYIAVPDMMNPTGSLKNYWFRSVHTFYFSMTTLRMIAALSNLQLIQMSSENSELWGVFRKAAHPERPELENAFDGQIRVFKAYRIKAAILDAQAGLRGFLPSRMRQWLRRP